MAYKISFAQTTFGLDIRQTPRLGSSASLSDDNTLLAHDIGGDTHGRFNITGLHFWGRCDFSVSIPVFRLANSSIRI